ncbi:hypothetical protein FA13DRAFT_1800533 [Coprinellus micaceus]|uniref:Nephrocystin 3-like N-terminal domain-containing protein n=1 Tax=Coprinellus micaceus TaxID=71717 RepID=A0A4Y7SGJ4_COPMI|nr:hypothetical protein FA13DRAFT_1800533 [Coprinellus micaceus]
MAITTSITRTTTIPSIAARQYTPSTRWIVSMMSYVTTVGLEEYVSKRAAHNSLERGTDTPKCHPETRQAIQENILSHIRDGKEKVLWLLGPVGAGKTAIMGSITEECYARRWLTGSFFISAATMKVDRCSKRYLIPTLAFHLLELNIPHLPAAILAAVAANPSTVDASKWPKVVLVNGVDECAADENWEYRTKHEHQELKEANYREVLSSLVKLTNDPSFPFRIIIASRPEHAIQGYFSSLPSDASTQVFLDDMYSPEDDVALYAQAMLTKIGRDYGLRGEWYNRIGPGKDDPCYLAQQSSGQFIYIATIIRYIQDQSGAPHKQLEHVLNCRPRNRSNPFTALDALYLGILKTSPDPELSAKWLHCIDGNTNLVNFAPASRALLQKPWYKRCILESCPGETEYLLGPLVSLIPSAVASIILQNVM